MNFWKLELKLHMVAKIMTLLYQEVVYFVKLHTYWFKNIMHFTGLSQKNTLSIVSVRQPKVLHFNQFILKLTCFLQFFGQTPMTTILLRYQLHHIFYQDRVNKMVLLIFQVTFVQDSQMLLLPQVQTIVTWFWDTTWCVQILKIVATCAKTVKGLFHQTLQLVVWIYAARTIQFLFISLTDIIWLKIYVHLKSIFNGISFSHLPVTRENSFVQKQSAKG